MNNLVVQLLLKTGTFSTDLKQAGGQVQSFKSNCQSTGKALDAFGKSIGINIGSIAKLGGAAGAAVMAFNGFKSVMMSTQTTADAFDGAVEGCKGVVDALKVSIASADFSTFQNGLWGVFDAAKAARDALDDLQDATLGYGMLSAKNRREFAEAQTAYREAKTPEERESARQKMEAALLKEEKEARNFETKNFNAIKSQVRARNTNINEKDITPGMIYEVAEIFNSVNSDERRKQAKQAADNVKKEAKKYASDSKRDQYYQKHQRELIIDTLLEMGDKKIQAVAQELQAGENARTAAAGMRKTYDRTIKGENKTTTPTKTTTVKAKEDELEIQKDSLTYWKNILSEETKYRDAVVKGTDEWDVHNEKVKEAEENIKRINDVQVKNDELMKGSLNYYTDLLSKLKSQRDALNLNMEPGKWFELNEQITEVEAKLQGFKNIDQYLDLNKALAVDPPTISSIQTALSLMKQIRDNTPYDYELFDILTERIKEYEALLAKVSGTEVKAPKTDTWNEFNQAMANTSTIVSSLTSTFKENSEVTAASILQMVSTALPAIGSLISSISALTAAEAVEAGVAATGKAVSTSKHWIEAIAAVAALGAAVAAALSAASKPNIQRFANGGIVGGSSFTGDRVSANVNSGEMILNRSQQARLFQMANGSPAGSKEVTFHISGTDLVGVMNNVNRKNKVIR